MENVTEELVRQNGNQAAAVMADYASQGGGGGGGSDSGSYPWNQLDPNAMTLRAVTSEDLAKISMEGQFESEWDLPEVGNLAVLDLKNGMIPREVTLSETNDGDPLDPEDPYFYTITHFLCSYTTFGQGVSPLAFDSFNPDNANNCWAVALDGTFIMLLNRHMVG